MRSVQCRCRDHQLDSKITLLLLAVVSIQLAMNTQVYSTTGEFLKFPRPLIHNVECQKSNVFFQLRHLTLTLERLFIHQFCQAFVEQIQSFVQLFFRDHERWDNKENIFEIENIYPIGN